MGPLLKILIDAAHRLQTSRNAHVARAELCSDFAIDEAITSEPELGGALRASTGGFSHLLDENFHTQKMGTKAVAHIAFGREAYERIDLCGGSTTQRDWRRLNARSVSFTLEKYCYKFNQHISVRKIV